MAKNSAWTKHRAERQKSNWAAARTRDEQRIKAHPKGQNVSPGAHNGHSIGGYSIKKHGAERAAELADARTRPGATRRAARRVRRNRAAATA